MVLLGDILSSIFISYVLFFGVRLYGILGIKRVERVWSFVFISFPLVFYDSLLHCLFFLIPILFFLRYHCCCSA
jgi:hypothetical protein